jgi:hypothetical protein
MVPTLARNARMGQPHSWRSMEQARSKAGRAPLCLLHMLSDSVSKMKKLILTLVIGCPLLFLACSRKQTDLYIIVHIFRNRSGPAAKQLNAAILALGAQNLKGSAGRPIIIATMELTSDPTTLSRIGHELRPEIVILDSRTDWRANEFGPPLGQSICRFNVTCVSGIPSWVEGEERQAAEVVLRALSDELSRGN